MYSGGGDDDGGCGGTLLLEGFLSRDEMNVDTNHHPGWFL